MRTLLTLLLVCAASPTFGLVYSWTDSGGVMHYTNKEYEIPPRYRAKVKSLYPEQTDASSPQQPAQAQQVNPQGEPVQKVGPEEPAKPASPVITPEPRKNPQERPTRRGRRTREPSDE